MSKPHLEENELADIMAMLPDADFGYDLNDQLVIYTGRYLKETEVPAKTHLQSYTRQVTNGVRWLEVNGGEYDYAWDSTRGWVSICYDYIMDRPDLGYPLRTNKGVRWALVDTEIASIPTKDAEWAKSEQTTYDLEPDGSLRRIKP